MSNQVRYNNRGIPQEKRGKCYNCGAKEHIIMKGWEHHCECGVWFYEDGSIYVRGKEEKPAFEPIPE